MDPYIIDVAPLKICHVHTCEKNDKSYCVPSNNLTYMMQCVTRPIKVCDSLEAFNRNFLWGFTPKKKKEAASCGLAQGNPTLEEWGTCATLYYNTKCCFYG